MIEKRKFGLTSEGEQVYAFTLSNQNGMSVTALNYGGVLQSIIVPDKNGIPCDVCLGYENVKTYEENNTYYGALVGRCANRIEHGQFCLNGTTYDLANNVGGNHLHGGVRGFGRYIWGAEICGETLVLERFSPDGEEGYPGNLRVRVTYSLQDDNTLTIRYHAQADADTIFNPLSHSYFNLNGHNSGGSVLKHTLIINSSAITEKDHHRAITGNFMPVDGTPFDFRTPKEIGRDIDSPHLQLQYCAGYDHNFVLEDAGTVKSVAILQGDRSGIRMELFTDRPGLQLHSGNSISDSNGKDNADYGIRCAVCMGTQCLPDAVHFPQFPSPMLKKGQIFHSVTAYRFTV